jgi:hypothetical protein
VAQDFHAKAKQDLERGGIVKEWYHQRAKTVLSRISCIDVLGKFDKRPTRGDREFQIACPFHGKDTHPSARYYPDSKDRENHIWCFTCRKSWNAIGLWMEYEGLRYSAALASMEAECGIRPPELPTELQEEPQVDEELVQLIKACESRLISNKEAVGVEAYLKLCVILDRLLYSLDMDHVKPEDAKKVLRGVLEKIGAKVRGTKA